MNSKIEKIQDYLSAVPELDFKELEEFFFDFDYIVNSESISEESKIHRINNALRNNRDDMGNHYNCIQSILEN